MNLAPNPRAVKALLINLLLIYLTWYDWLVNLHLTA